MNIDALAMTLNKLLSENLAVSRALEDKSLNSYEMIYYLLKITDKFLVKTELRSNALGFNPSEVPFLNYIKLTEKEKKMLSNIESWASIFKVCLAFVAGNKGLLDMERARGRLEGVEKFADMTNRDDKENRLIGLLY